MTPARGVVYGEAGEALVFSRDFFRIALRPFGFAFPEAQESFAILGQGFVSVNVWGKGNGLFSQNYSVENSYPLLTRQALERTAIACTWDSRIMNYELRLWHRYLLTKRTPADKRRYLDTFISGDLEDENVCAAPSAPAASEPDGH